MLDFRMNTFLTVCRCMNFTRASEELHITQPAVSQHIRYLEKHYGKKLFYYEGKRLGLTDAGELLLNASLAMRDDEMSLQSRMNREERREALRIGIAEPLGDAWVTDVLKEYLEKRKKSDGHRGVSLRLKTGNSAELLENLEQNEISFALIDAVFSRKKYEYSFFGKQRLILVCSPDYIFSEEPEELKNLFRECLLIGGKEEGTRTVWEAFLNSADVCVDDFSNVVEIGSLYTMKELTKAGCGITFLYEAAVWKELNCGELREVKLKDFQVSRDFTFVWKKGSPAAGQYRELFGQYSIGTGKKRE